MVTYSESGDVDIARGVVNRYIHIAVRRVTWSRRVVFGRRGEESPNTAGQDAG